MVDKAAHETTALPEHVNLSQDQVPTLPLAALAQYVKDVSFETAGPWALSTDNKEVPEIGLNIEVVVNPVADKRYEVELHIDASAKQGEKNAFVMELVYAGLFEVDNLEEQYLAPLLLIECPRLLFPFARNLVSDLTREGGFPPLSLAPVDFAAIYRQKMQ